MVQVLELFDYVPFSTTSVYMSITFSPHCSVALFERFVSDCSALHVLRNLLSMLSSVFNKLKDEKFYFIVAMIDWDRTEPFWFIPSSLTFQSVW